MRYLFSKSEEKLIRFRQEYVYDVFKLYTLVKGEKDNFIVLDGFPLKYIDIFFIIGHTHEVYKFIKNNIKEIYEETIVIISCNTSLFNDFSTYNKRIYVSKNKMGLAEAYDGSKWGFDFPITETELNIYKNKASDIITRLEDTMMEI